MSSDESGQGVLNLSGPVTLYETAEVREALLAALAAGKETLQVNLDDAGPWDVAGLQLLIAAVASGQKAGVSVRFAHVPGVCREVAERSGLLDWLADASDSYA